MANLAAQPAGFCPAPVSLVVSIRRRLAERGKPVRVSRRGKTVAVVLSIREYQRLVHLGDFWTPLIRFREQIERGEREAIEAGVFADVRDPSPGVAWTASTISTTSLL